MYMYAVTYGKGNVFIVRLIRHVTLDKGNVDPIAALSACTAMLDARYLMDRTSRLLDVMMDMTLEDK